MTSRAYRCRTNEYWCIRNVDNLKAAVLQNSVLDNRTRSYDNLFRYRTCIDIRRAEPFQVEARPPPDCLQIHRHELGQHQDIFESGGKSCQKLREEGTCGGPYTGTGPDNASCQRDARARAPAACQGCLGHCRFRQ